MMTPSNPMHKAIWTNFMQEEIAKAKREKQDV